jgi:AraC family transcriptional regulator
VPIVVFPSVPVLIRHSRGTTVSSPNVAMLYNPDQVFERELRDPRGDRCLVIEVTELIRDELIGGEFDTIVAPVPAEVHFRRHVLAQRLRGDEDGAAEELALDVLRGTIPRAARAVSRRAATEREHRELAEAAKELLWSTATENVPVAELARRLAVSPFHLTRVFREQTGFALYEYRLQLRLRLALERIAAGTPSITALALELGFASHSHFTNQFRRAFGVTPSAARAH